MKAEITPGPETDFNKLEEVVEGSVLAKLYQIIDDIDTALDMFKPELSNFEKYVIAKIKEKDLLVVSDGYKLYFVR